MFIRGLLIICTALALTACANTQTSCPLNNEYGYCASVEDTYNAAVAGGGDNENVLARGGQSKGQSGGQSQGVGGPIKNPLYSPGPGNGLSGPIFQPAVPRRLWVAPWTDPDGTLHSGEYLYFLSPGHWRYGPLKSPGAAAGVMGPVAPNDLGFTPGVPDRNRPARPGHIQQPHRSVIHSQSGHTGTSEVFPVHHSK